MSSRQNFDSLVGSFMSGKPLTKPAKPAESKRKAVESQPVIEEVESIENINDADLALLNFESYYTTLLEALTNAMKALLAKYPDMSEDQMERWAAADPTGMKAINLPAMLALRANKKLKSSAEITRLVKQLPEPNATLPWVLRQIKTDQIHIPEDIADVASVLKTYFKFRKTKHWPEGRQDLHKFASFADLSEVVSEIIKSSLGSAMQKKMSILPDTELVGTSPPYELIRIYPTRQAQKSLSQYREVNGKEYARWCVGRPDEYGERYFFQYLGHKGNTKEQVIARHDDPLFSFYMVAKEGIPYALFDFQSNSYMNIHDTEGRGDPDYSTIIKPLIIRSVPGAKDIVDPAQSPQPSKILAKILQNRSHDVANAILCKIESRKAGTIASIHALKNEGRIKNFVDELTQTIVQRLPGDIQDADNKWASKYSSPWITGAARNRDVAKTIANIPTEALKKAFTEIIKTNSLSCANINTSKSLIDSIMSIEDTSMNESRLSKILGTAALAGTLGFSTLNPSNNTPSIRRAAPVVQNAAKPQPPAPTVVDRGPKHLPERNWKSRGLKNNNPGNIKKGERWDGVIGHDGPFLRFKSMEYGIRAMSKLLMTYQSKYGLNTVEQIITKFAPRKDHNPTETYINDVCDYMGVKRDQKIDLNNKTVLTDLVNAMIRMETGRDLSDNVVNKGIRMSES